MKNTTDKGGWNINPKNYEIEGQKIHDKDDEDLDEIIEAYKKEMERRLKEIEN